MGFAYFILGRLNAPLNPAAAKAAYEPAARVYASLPDDGVHPSHALMQLCALARANGQDDQAVFLADQAIPLVALAENAALLATLKLIMAEALAAQDHPAEAAALRLDSLPAARYGIKSEPEVRARGRDCGHRPDVPARIGRDRHLCRLGKFAMIVVPAMVIGAFWGAWTAIKRGGRRLDAAQYGTVYAIGLGLLGVLVSVILDRLIH